MSILLFLLVRIARLLYEVLMADKLVYMKVTLPRADSKLDKEQSIFIIFFPNIIIFYSMQNYFWELLEAAIIL